jgi:hypothetical protein
MSPSQELAQKGLDRNHHGLPDGKAVHGLHAKLDGRSPRRIHGATDEDEAWSRICQNPSAAVIQFK